MLKRKLSALGLTLICVTFFINALSFAGELADIRSAIHARDAKWIAGETSVSKLPPEKRRMRLGLIFPPLINDIETLSYKAFDQSTQASDRPATFDWRNNGGNFITPVRDQGNCGSCWAFATTGALESITLITNNTPDVDLNLAEQILVSCSGAGDCGGGYIDSASDFFVDPGLPSETCYPYTATNGYCGNTCSDWQSHTNKITSWTWVATTSPSVSAITNALYNYGPLVTTMDVYTDFFYYRSGVYSHTWGYYQGGHAILIVGYDDYGQYFIVKNSWGTGWGESGYFKVAYSQVSGTAYFGYWTIAYSASPDTSTIAVNSPDGSESWQAGATQTIRWAYSGNPGSYVKIELLKGSSVVSTITSYAPTGTNGSGSYNWLIPSTQASGSDYRIRVTSTSSSSLTDTSNGDFSILGPTITVTSPNGAESWLAGATQTIRWAYTGDPGYYVKIELLKGSSVVSTVTSYASKGTNGSGSYNWLIPSTQASGSDYRIRVTSTSSSSLTDTSNGDFSILGPTITVTSPNGAESWPAGATQTIRWAYSGNPGSYVKIELLKGSSVVSTVTSYASKGTNGSGSYNWLIPSTQTQGSDYTIRITSTSNGLVTDFSDRNFTIN